MKRYSSLEEMNNTPSGFLGALMRVIKSAPSGLETEADAKDQGGVWVLQSFDTDGSISQVFGLPLMDLEFERVHFHPDEEYFLCNLKNESSYRDILVIPDSYWLDDGWRAWLLAQL